MFCMEISSIKNVEILCSIIMMYQNTKSVNIASSSFNFNHNFSINFKVNLSLVAKPIPYQWDNGKTLCTSLRTRLGNISKTV